MQKYNVNVENLKSGMLYDKNAELIAIVKYEKVDDNLFIHMLERFINPIPNEAFLVMKTNDNNNITFLVSLRCISLNQGIDNCALCMGHQINIDKGINTRGDLRVPVELPITLESLALENPVKAFVKNISAGGLFLLAGDSISQGMHIFFELPIEKNILYLSAEILNKIPTANENVWGYGCRFISLDTTSESKIRQFVFQENSRYRKNKK